jgi:hypothetical protein
MKLCMCKLWSKIHVGNRQTSLATDLGLPPRNPASLIQQQTAGPSPNQAHCQGQPAWSSSSRKIGSSSSSSSSSVFVVC